MTRPQRPKGMDIASWLRLRAERRGQAGVVAGYVHELSDRHYDGSGDDGGAAGDSGSESGPATEGSA